MTTGGTTTRLAVIVDANTARAITGFGKLGASANAANRDVQRLGKDSARAGDRLGSSMRRVIPDVRKVGLVATGATALITAAAVSAARSILKIGIDFQGQLNTLQAVAHATDAQMQAVSQRARDLGNDLELPATSAADAAAAMTELAKGNLSAQQAMDAAKGTLLLAAAAQVDGAEAAKIQANALNAFGLSADQAGHVADVLANAANSATGEMHDFALGLAASSAVAAQFGISVDDTVTALALLANKGIQGSDAGTSLKSALLALASPSKQAREALEDLSLRVFDAKGNFVGLRSVAEQLSKAQKHLSQEAFAAAVSTAFGSDAARAAGVLAANGADGFDKMSEAVGRAGGAAAVAKAQMKGVGGAIQGLQSQIETVKIDIFQREAPFLEKFIRGLSDRLPGAADAGLHALDTLTKKIEDDVPALRREFQKVAPDIQRYLTDKVHLAGEAVDQVLKPALRGVENVLAGVLPKVTGAGNAFDDVLRQGIAAAGRVARDFERDSRDVGRSLGDIGDRALDLGRQAMPLLSGGLHATAAALSGVTEAAAGALHVLSPLTSTVLITVGAVKGLQLAAGVFNSTQTGLSKVTGAFTRTGEKIGTVLGSITANVSAAFGRDLLTAGARGEQVLNRTRSAFTALGQAVPFAGAALLGIGYAIEQDRRSIQEMTDRVQGLTFELHKGGTAADDAGKQLLFIAGAAKQLGDAGGIASTIGDKLTTSLRDGAKAADEQFNKLSPLDQASIQVQAAQTDLAHAVKEYGENSQEAAFASGEFKLALSDQKAIQDAVNVSIDAGIGSLTDYTAKVALAAETESSRIQQELGVEQGILNLSTAHDVAAEAVQKYGKNSKEATQASLQYRIQQEGLKGQIFAAAEAARTAAIAHSNGATAEDKARDGALAYGSELGKLASKLAPGSALRRELEALINQLDRAARDRTAHLTIVTRGVVNQGAVPLAAAEGGPVKVGRPYLIGENGPELLVPNFPGYIFPNAYLPKNPGGPGAPTSFLGGGGGPVFNINLNVTVPTGAHPADVGAGIVKAIREYEKRSGTAWRSAA